MSDKFQNRYRIPSTRLQHWNYGWNAAYFVTICTQNRECFLGDVMDGKIKLSGVGIIADILWYEIKNHAKHVELGEFRVMPNHIHGILVLEGNNNNNTGETHDVETMDAVETTHALSLQTNETIGQTRFQNQGKNTLSSIVGSYKSAVSKHAHRLGFDFEWQTRFHDHIIRDNQSFKKISEYIINNPLNWETDKFNPSNANAGE